MSGGRPRTTRAAIPAGPPLPPSFYRRPTLRVARELLGSFLVRQIGSKSGRKAGGKAGRTILAGRIVEVEAYLGRTDPASHAFRGKTARNDVMFRGGGLLYVYFTYGMHHCANVVTGRAGSGSAVLIRAIEPVASLGRMAANRGLIRPPATQRMIAGGPARLCQALGIGAADNGIPLQGPEIFIVPGPPPPQRLVGRSPRIGISAGREKLWRFFIKDSSSLSRP
jgi:DNA-3-methyladenine glycosylase